MTHHGGAPPPPAAVTTSIGTYRAEDYGASSAKDDSSGAINLAAAVAATSGGGVVQLDSGRTYRVRQGVKLPNNVELVIPTGTTLQAGPGFVGDVVANAGTATVGVAVTGGGTIDVNFLASGSSGNGLSLSGVADARLAVTVVNAFEDGIELISCTRARLDVVVSANGRHGVYHSGSTFCVGRIVARDNGQRVAGSGVTFDAASTDNSYSISATDTRAGGAKTQQYGMLEVAASGCDRNTLGAASLAGNAVGTLSLVGAASGFVAGNPTGPAGGQLAGNYPSPTVAGPVASAALAGYPWANAALAGYPWNDADLAATVARANQLVNGGFEIWQRGNGPFTVNGTYGPDRWALVISGTDTLSVSKDTTHQDVGSLACAACTFVLGTGAGASGVEQLLKFTNGGADGYQLASRQISLSMRVSVNVANALRLGIFSDGTGGTTTYSAYHPGDGAFHTLTVTATLPSNATYMDVQAFFAASCTAYLDNAMLVVSSVPANYVPLPAADDLARCMRYYETAARFYGDPLGAGLIASATNFLIWQSFKVHKAVTPTVTVTTPANLQAFSAAGGTWVPITTGSAAFSGGADGAIYSLNVATQTWAVGQAIGAMGGADAKITIEANP